MLPDQAPLPPLASSILAKKNPAAGDVTRKIQEVIARPGEANSPRSLSYGWTDNLRYRFKKPIKAIEQGVSSLATYAFWGRIRKGHRYAGKAFPPSEKSWRNGVWKISGAGIS
ncbi:hypothetical protein ASZ90_010764 [hydrocarbon metagenome]|uniref:Uncharacterized protein n=1 Tax=hydrocarbon metagenome TaxID=938273 RepID=A0A0W8FF24_9ZZZZ